MAAINSGSTGWKYGPLTSLTGTFTRSYRRLDGAQDLVAAHIGHGDGRVVPAC
jgi:hypothetical protein